MRQRGRKVWNGAAGPRALAVISCALAILAAQPAGGGNAKGQGVAAVRMAGEMAKSEVRNLKSETRVLPPRREEGSAAILPRGGRSSLHVLATVEILQRLLAFELRPM